MGDQAVLELIGVSYRYPGSARRALDGVDLAVGAGEVVGIVGANDAGKSTLCLVASGLAPSAIGGQLGGEIRVGGEVIARDVSGAGRGSTAGGALSVGRPPHVLAGLIGMAFQDPATQRSGVTGTVFEEVAFGPVNLGWPAAESVAATRAALEAVGIADLAERHPARLSGGQSQLVAIASVLAMRPRVMVLDEPLAQLDPEATALVVAALRSIAAGGTSLLIAEHRTDVLASFATRVVALDAGRIALDGRTEAVLRDARLAAIGVAVLGGPVA